MLSATGWSQAQLAERIGVSQNDISRYLHGREPRGRTMEAIRKLAIQLDVLDDEADRQRIPIMGRVGAGGSVEPEIEQVPEDGLEQIELPPSAIIASSMVSDPIGFQVSGESMYPRYGDGDILIVERDQPWAIETMIGLHAVVVVYDDEGERKRYVKKIMPGTRTGFYTLVSLNVPSFEARIAWASPIRVIIPNIGLRRVTSAKRRAAPRGARATRGN